MHHPSLETGSPKKLLGSPQTFAPSPSLLILKPSVIPTPGGDLDQFLESLSRAELKDLFKATFSMLTHSPWNNLSTSHPILKTLLAKVQGDYSFSNASYKGELVNGLPHGRGVAKYDNGNLYEGDFHNGLKQGYGSYKYLAGDTYKGEFSLGKSHGLGTYSYGRAEGYGDTYQGCFKEGKKHGPGVYAFRNGNIEFGIFEEDKQDGLFMWINSERTQMQFGTRKKGVDVGEVLVFKLHCPSPKGEKSRIKVGTRDLASLTNEKSSDPRFGNSEEVIKISSLDALAHPKYK